MTLLPSADLFPSPTLEPGQLLAASDATTMPLLPSPDLLPSPSLFPGQTVAVSGPVPSPDEVAPLLHERLFVNGVHQGTFTSETSPTRADVRVLIDIAAADVATRARMEIPEEEWPEARRLAALQAASLVEASYFPGEVNDENRTAYRQYQAMYLSGLEAFIARLQSPGAIRLA